MMNLTVDLNNINIYNKILLVSLILVIFYSSYFLLKNIIIWLLKFKREIKIGPISLGKQICDDEHTQKEKHIISEKDVIYILKYQQKILNKIFYIRDKEILREQMTFAESRCDLILNKAEILFRNIIEDSNKDYLFSKEYITFKAVLELIREKVIIKLRIMCKENHFSEKVEDDFREYVKIHNNLFVTVIKNLIINYYPFRNTIINYDKMDIIYIDISEAISEIIYKSREIAIKKEKEMEDLEKDFEVEYMRIIEGININKNEKIF